MQSDWLKESGDLVEQSFSDFYVIIVNFCHAKTCLLCRLQDPDFEVILVLADLKSGKCLKPMANLISLNTLELYIRQCYSQDDLLITIVGN